MKRWLLTFITPVKWYYRDGKSEWLKPRQIKYLSLKRDWYAKK